MPVQPQLREMFIKHKNLCKKNWIPMPENNFTIEEGEFDYDISSMDVDETKEVAGNNLIGHNSE